MKQIQISCHLEFGLNHERINNFSLRSALIFDDVSNAILAGAILVLETDVAGTGAVSIRSRTHCRADRDRCNENDKLCCAGYVCKRKNNKEWKNLRCECVG